MKNSTKKIISTAMLFALMIVNSSAFAMNGQTSSTDNGYWNKWRIGAATLAVAPYALFGSVYAYKKWQHKKQVKRSEEWKHTVKEFRMMLDRPIRPIKTDHNAGQIRMQWMHRDNISSLLQPCESQTVRNNETAEMMKCDAELEVLKLKLILIGQSGMGCLATYKGLEQKIKMHSSNALELPLYKIFGWDTSKIKARNDVLSGYSYSHVCADGMLIGAALTSGLVLGASAYVGLKEVQENLENQRFLQGF